MKKIIWFTMQSLDGFVTDRDNNIFFHEPTEDVHHTINNLNATNAAMLLDPDGYHIMRYWDHPPSEDLKVNVVKTYTHQWQHMKKIIVGQLDLADTQNNYILWDHLTPDRVDQLLQTLNGNLVIGSTSLAWQLLRLKKITDIQLITVPILLGAGQNNFADAGETPLKLVHHHIFQNGWTYMHYQVTTNNQVNQNDQTR